MAFVASTFLPLPGLTLPRAAAHKRSPWCTPRATAKPPRPKPSNVQIFLQRFGDTVLDAGIHYARLFSNKQAQTVGARVVILGTGWAAHSLVKVIDHTQFQSITVISPRNFFFFTPLLSATAVGTIEFRSIVEPIRKANPYINYYEAYASDIDVSNQTVLCVHGQRDGQPVSNASSFQVPYDFLVVAVGESTATFGVSGAMKYAHFLKEISDARKLRCGILDILERASLPVWSDEQRRRMLHFVVVGGGPTGCEFAAELSDFVSKDLAPRYGKELVSEIRVTLLQSGKSLLTQFENSLQQLALQSFSGRIEVLFGARVTQVNEHALILANGDELEYGLLVWAAGNGTREIVRNLMDKAEANAGDEDEDETVVGRKKLVVDGWLRVKRMKNVFALGDCAVMEEEALPSTAQVAGQQGAFLGRLLSKADLHKLRTDEVVTLADSGGKQIREFNFLSLGIMAYLGDDRAIVQFETMGSNSVQLSGRLAYALWRSVYAVKQVDVRNRVLVLFDYFKSRVYGRDISQF